MIQTGDVLLNVFGFRLRYPKLFNQSQDWFKDEGFMFECAKPIEDQPVLPPAFRPGAGPESGELPRCVDLIAAYVAAPNDPVWKFYLWTSDTDHLGQRVYIGKNERRMEIHRHIHLTDRFGVPVW